MRFAALPNLSHATPCPQVIPAEDPPADTLIVSAGPFSRAGALFRQAGADPKRAVLTVGGGTDEIVLTVQDFLDIADACRK